MDDRFAQFQIPAEFEDYERRLMTPKITQFSRREFLPILLSLVVWCGTALGATDCAGCIANLISPTKLATLGPRKANPRDYLIQSLRCQPRQWGQG